MDNAELINRLRDVPCWAIGTEAEETMLAAADALEAAEQRIEELKRGWDKALARATEYEAKAIELEAQIPKDGEWIDMGDFAMCSVCKIAQRKKYRQYNGGFMWVRTDFCPSCGSRMAKGEQE